MRDLVRKALAHETRADDSDTDRYTLLLPLVQCAIDEQHVCSPFRRLDVAWVIVCEQVSSRNAHPTLQLGFDLIE
jgi:hypothetical protein